MRSYKNILFGLVCILCSMASHAVSTNNIINIVSFTIKPVMPGDLNVWTGMPDGLSIVAQMNAGTVEIHSKLVVQIKRGGGLVCGNTAATGLPIDPFKTRNFTGGDITTAFMGCSLMMPGSYTICAQFFNEDGAPLSTEVCKDFIVENVAPAPPSYSPPENITPVNNKIFAVEEMWRPVIFSWTPVTPTPVGPITYRLKIWQLTDGQTGAQAMQSNQPIVSRDIENATQIAITNFLNPMFCKPPSLCKFIWDVQALSKEAVPVGKNNGTSQPTIATLAAAEYIIRIDSMRIACTATPGIYSFSYYITNPNPGTAKLTNFVITSSVPAGATMLGFLPPLLTTIVSGSQLVITGTFSASPALTNICIGAEITDVINTFSKASRDTCMAVIPCRCDACDENKLSISTVPTTGIVINGNNTLTLNQPITITTTPAKLIKSVKAELIYFEFIPESEECLPCNKDSKTYGNLDNGTLAAVTGLGVGTHSLLWNFSPPISFAGGKNAVIVITLPPSVKCCSATIKWCIRYVVTFNDCTVCNKLVCYEKKKDGCTTGIPNSNNN